MWCPNVPELLEVNWCTSFCRAQQLTRSENMENDLMFEQTEKR